MAVRRSCVFIGAVLTVLCFAVPASAGIGPWQFIRGDVDGDGDNDVVDGVNLLNYLFSPGATPLPCEDAADVNDDGAITLIDAVYQLTHALAGGIAPPAPYPQCSVDLTFDSLGCAGPLGFCPVADNPPDLVVEFCDDALEESPGVHLARNIAEVDAGNFGELRVLMRRVTLQVGAAAGEVQVSLTGPIQLFDAAGNLLGSQFTIPVSALPTDLFINGADAGSGSIVAVLTGVGGSLPEVVNVEVGHSPGLVGRELVSYPFFEFVRTFNSDEPAVQAALDSSLSPERVGASYRVYVVDHKTPAEWAADNTLVDVSGGFELGTLTDTSIQDNTLDVWSAGLDAGTGVVGKAYDVVFDFGLDGTLDPGDLVDGLNYDEAGFYIVGNLTASGPHAVTETLYSGGAWLGQDLYYPSDIDTLTDVPIVVISHGNGHQYTWYDYLGNHLASWGYVVMSHQNETGPGITTASTTTLTNTDYLLDNLATIAGGALDGRVDTDWIGWVGHSRGGEGVAYAYDRLVNGSVPVGTSFTDEQVQYVSSIAPTVFFNTGLADPNDVNYHLLAGAADGDVNGCANCTQCQFFRIHQRAAGVSTATYVQGADHNDFNCCGFQDGQGPAQIGRPAAQGVAKAYYLAHLEYYARGNAATKDYLVRNFSSFHPVGISSNVVVANQWKNPNETDYVIENYQGQPALGVASTLQPVDFDVTNAFEGLMDDNGTTFTFSAADAMNGMTQAESPPDSSRGIVFDWANSGTRFYELTIDPAQANFGVSNFLTFRVAQGSRHPNTNALAGTLDFTVTLQDGTGNASSMNFGEFGTITRPYLRSGCGTGSGWANEFNIVRLRLTDFQNNDTGLDLNNITSVRFDFGTGFGSATGRIGLDDVVLTRD